MGRVLIYSHAAPGRAGLGPEAPARPGRDAHYSCVIVPIPLETVCCLGLPQRTSEPPCLSAGARKREWPNAAVDAIISSVTYENENLPLRRIRLPVEAWVFLFVTPRSLRRGREPRAAASGD